VTHKPILGRLIVFYCVRSHIQLEDSCAECRFDPARQLCGSGCSRLWSRILVCKFLTSNTMISVSEAIWRLQRVSFSHQRIAATLLHGEFNPSIDPALVAGGPLKEHQLGEGQHWCVCAWACFTGNQVFGSPKPIRSAANICLSATRYLVSCTGQGSDRACRALSRSWQQAPVGCVRWHDYE
jgi:hypothetical protein